MFSLSMVNFEMESEPQYTRAFFAKESGGLDDVEQRAGSRSGSRKADYVGQKDCSQGWQD